MKVLAYAAMEKSSELVPFTYSIDSLEHNQVLVRVLYCGICHSDVHLIDNDWGFSNYPLVPGHEIVGVVQDIGSTVKNLKIGDFIGIGWQSGSCDYCDACVSGKQNLCFESSSTCVSQFGGFASHVLSTEKFCIKLPDFQNLAEIAPLLCGGITVFSPLYHQTQAGDKVGIVGVGGLGHLAIRFAKALGTEVWAFTSTPEKKNFILDLGADHVILSHEMIENRLLDCLLITSTAELHWQSYLKLLKPNGKMIFVSGNAGMLHVPVAGFMLNQISITGSVIGNISDLRKMIEIAHVENIGADVEVFPIEEVNTALTKLKNNELRFRAVLELKN